MNSRVIYRGEEKRPERKIFTIEGAQGMARRGDTTLCKDSMLECERERVVQAPPHSQKYRH